MNKKALRGVVDTAFILAVFLSVEFVTEWNGSFLTAFAVFAVTAVILGIIRFKLDKTIEKECQEALEQEIMLNKARKSAELQKMLSPTVSQPTAPPTPAAAHIDLEPIAPKSAGKKQEPVGNVNSGMPELKTNDDSDDWLNY